jgi:Anti-sigma factor NepR
MPVQLRRAIPQTRPFRITGGPAPGIGRDLQEELATRLRASSDEVLHQPLPAALRALVEKLEAASPRRAQRAAPKRRARAKA